MDLKHVAERVWGIRGLDETLFWCNADEESAWFDSQLDRLDAKLEMITENVLDGKVVTDHVKRTRKSRLTNVTRTQKPHSDTNVQCPFLCFKKRLFVWIDGGDTGTNRLPLVPVTASTASTIKNVRIWFDPLIDEVTLRLIMAFTQLIHVT